MELLNLSDYKPIELNRPFPTDRTVDLMSAIEAATDREVDEVVVGPLRCIFFTDPNETILVMFKNGLILLAREYAALSEQHLLTLGHPQASISRQYPTNLN